MSAWWALVPDACSIWHSLPRNAAPSASSAAAPPHRKLYWGGGSVFLATAHLDWRLPKPLGPERFEDGTLPFLDILALRHGCATSSRELQL